VLRAMSGFDLAVVLVAKPVLPKPERLLEAARELGLRLVHEPGDDEDEHEGSAYVVEGGPRLIIALMPMPHPDAAKLSRGPTAPKPAEAERAPAHYFVTLLGPGGSPRERDLMLAKLTAAVVRSSPAVAAMFARGAVLH